MIKQNWYKTLKQAVRTQGVGFGASRPFGGLDPRQFSQVVTQPAQVDIGGFISGISSQIDKVTQNQFKGNQNTKVNPVNLQKDPFLLKTKDGQQKPYDGNLEQFLTNSGMQVQLWAHFAKIFADKKIAQQKEKQKYVSERHQFQSKPQPSTFHPIKTLRQDTKLTPKKSK